MKKLLSICGLLIMLSVLLVSCKKKDDVKVAKRDILTGSWSETSQKPYNRILHFETDGKFSMEVLDNTGYANLTLKGKYVIEGDSLTVTLLESVEQQGGGKEIKTLINNKIFEKGTFNVKDFVLTLNYITYPADAPVLTQAKYNKILKID